MASSNIYKICGELTLKSNIVSQNLEKYNFYLNNWFNTSKVSNEDVNLFKKQLNIEDCKIGVIYNPLDIALESDNPRKVFSIIPWYRSDDSLCIIMDISIVGQHTWVNIPNFKN